VAKARKGEHGEDATRDDRSAGEPRCMGLAMKAALAVELGSREQRDAIRIERDGAVAPTLVARTSAGPRTG